MKFVIRMCRALCTAALVLLLGGCAAQLAFRDGQDLVKQGRIEEGLAKMQEASQLEPGVAEYRLAFLQTRERYVNSSLGQADALREQGKLSEAQDLYRAVAAFQPGNDKARAAIRSIEAQQRADEAIVQAESALAAKDYVIARARIRAAQLEVPNHAGARALLQRIDGELAKPPAEAALATAYRKPITIEFKDVALKTVFEVISRTSGLNFLFDKDVRTDQKTSIYLKNSTIENAVNLTLLTNQLEQRVLDANTVLVYPNTQAKQREYQPLNVRSFYLANAEAKTVAASLKALLKTRDIVVDDKLNLVIIRDSPEAIRLAEKVVALHDVPEPEVMLEVEILEVKRTRLLDLGIRWPDRLTLAPLPSAAGGQLTLADLRRLHGANLSATISPLTLSAKKSDTDANILANPRIRARNHEKAKILIGERVPNITTTATSTGFVSESVNYVDIGLKLEVEPAVFLEGEVAIKIALEVSNIISQIQTKSGSIAYEIGTRTAQTVLRLKDGENQVLAGLINDEDRRSADKVPGFGEAPIIGRLFGGQSDDSAKTEIVLSITPRIVRNVRRPDPSIIEFESGTETSFGLRSAAGSANPVANVGTGAAANPSSPHAPATAPATVTPATPPYSSAAPSPSSPPAMETAAAGLAALRLQGPSQVKPGELFALQIVVQSDQPIASLPMALGFDPNALQVVSVTEGEFLRQGGAQTTFASRVDPAGQILMTGTRAGESGASSPGSFAVVNFRATAAATGDARVQVLTAAPVGLGGTTVPLGPGQPLVIRVGN